MAKTIKILYTNTNAGENIVEEMKKNFDSSNYEQVCMLHMDSKDSNEKILNEVFKMFNWKYKDFQPNDAFTAFKCPDNVTHIEMAIGDVAKMGSEFYIREQSGWTKLKVDIEIPVTKTKKEKINKPTNKPIAINTQSNIIHNNISDYVEGEIVKIIGTKITKGGVEKIILSNRNAQVVGFSRDFSKLKLILLNDNGELQTSVITVDINDIFPKEIKQVV